MKIGVPTEIKQSENRVGLVPSAVMELAHAGHQIFVQSGAGAGIGATDSDYQAAGAEISRNAADLFEASDMIVKVKEPQAPEYDLLRDSHILFTYLHLAANETLTQALLASKVTGIAYETITNQRGALPLLQPMSEIAGRISVQAGAYSLQKHAGGAGILIGGATGVSAAEVVIIGGGVVGTNAAKMALGLGGRVTILDRSLTRLAELEDIFCGQVNTVYSTNNTIAEWCARADLIIGAVLIPGAAAPKLISRAQLKDLKPGAVLVDVAIDQGGCFETSHPTTHDSPTYVVDGIVHYCVANMPGAVPKTSAYALNNATLPYVKKLANEGLSKALSNDSGFARGLNTYRGQVVHPAVAEAFDMQLVDAGALLLAA